jgi:very-short-patch-repair endonuclease
VITRRECLDLGVTQRQLEWMARNGELARVFCGVYRHPAVTVTIEQRLYAACCAVGSQAVISHRSALALHEARNFSSQLVELSVSSRALPLREGLVVHRTTTLAPRDICRRNGLVVTTRARSIVDAAAVMSPAVVVKIAQEWMAHRLLRVADLEEVLGRVPHRTNAGELRRLLANAEIGESDSVAEADLGRILQRAGMPPVLHHVVTTALGSTFELDWSYPNERLGLELDGYGVHLRSVDAFDNDRFRRNELEIAGWTILNFTSRMCRRRRSLIVDQVRRARALSRSPQ